MKRFKNVFLIMTALGIIGVVAGCSRINRQLSTAGPPKGAVVLFDGSDLSNWIGVKTDTAGWKIVDGTMEIVPRKVNIMTKEKFGDFKLHIEFKMPPKPLDVEKPKKANSGVYLQGRYEVQIFDSYGLEPHWQGCGAIYKIKAPDKNVCKKLGEWQSYDITFRSARFTGQGQDLKKIANARVTVVHNDVVIHDDVEVPNKTKGGQSEGSQPGPILLQDHGSKIQFRNIWLLPL